MVPEAYCILIGGIMLYVNKLWANMRGSKGGVLRVGGRGAREKGTRGSGPLKSGDGDK